MKKYLFAILIIAFALRFINLDSIPPSLNWDEVSIGYNAYSILHTGRDEWGELLPISFKAYGDYKLPAYIYLDVPFIWLFGLNEIGVRFPSVLLGIGIIILIFLIIKEITNNSINALLGMFLVTILPWTILFSRIALEANLALFLTLASFYFLLLSLRKNNMLPLAAVFLGLSLFAYNSSRVLFFPFLILIIIVFYRDLLRRKKEFLIATLVILTFSILAFRQAFFVDSGARYKWTTILDEGAISQIEEERNLSKLPPLLKVIIYNRVSYFLNQSSKNYITNFNPQFLFIDGGSNYQFSTPGSGLIYWYMFPLIFLGILQTILYKKKWQLFILGWLLIAPLPSAITRDAPHALRSIFMIIPIIVLSVQGIDLLSRLLKQKLFKILIVFLIIISSVNLYSFWENYSGNYVKQYSWSWQYGYKEAVQYILENSSKYSKIAITKEYGEPHEFLLFYLRYDPFTYQHDPNLVRYEKSQWFWVDRFDKFVFLNDSEVKEKLLGLHNTLLVTSPSNYPIGSRFIKTINFLNGEPAFDIVAID